MYAERKKPHTSILPYLKAKEAEAGKKPASSNAGNTESEKELDQYQKAKLEILRGVRSPSILSGRSYGGIYYKE